MQLVSQEKEQIIDGALTLLTRLQQRTARIAVIGLGYAGLPLLCELAEAGFPTVGIDKDVRRVTTLSNLQSPFPDIPDERLKVLQDQLQFTTSYEVIRDCDVSIICVPTPLKNQQPDLSAVIEATRSLKTALGENHLVVLESTTYPGTTEEVLRPILETEEHRVGENLFLAYSPERVDPGNRLFGMKNTPKLVSGITPTCKKLVQTLYESIADKVTLLSSPKVAEAAKVLENTYRFVNIALVNEFAVMCHELNLDVWEVIQAAASKPYGFTPFWPGLGVGGHCIPVDPCYLSWKAREHGTPLHLVEAARDTNEGMPEYVVKRIAELLNRNGLALIHSRILVLGVAYKPGVPDARESPALPLLRSLLRHNAQVFYHDPFIPEVRVGNNHLHSVDNLEAELEQADLVVVATNHPGYDWPRIEGLARRVFDTRGALYQLNSPKITRL